MSNQYSYGQPQIDPRTGRPIPAQQVAPGQPPPPPGGMFRPADDVQTEYYHGGYGTTAAQQQADFYGAPQPVVDVDPRTGTYGAAPVSVPQQGTPPAGAAPYAGAAAVHPPPAAPPVSSAPAPTAARATVTSARATVGAPSPVLGGYRERVPAPPAAPVRATGVRPPTLRASRHNARTDRLGQLVLPRGQAGLVLGRDQGGQPVAIRPFQRDGVRIALLGSLWMARLVVFRSLALGARVVVHTERGADWHGLGRWAVGRDDRLTVLEHSQPVLVPATAASPALTVHDFGALGAVSATQPGPYRADLTVLSQVSAAGFMAVEQADLVLAQRLTAAEAYAAQSVRRYPESTVDMLQRLGDDMLALIGDGPDSYLWTTPTHVETEAFGLPY